MNLRELSSQELAESLRVLLQHAQAEARVGDSLPATLQELEVQEIKRELQSRTLQETQAQLEEARARFSDFYEHLPIGYVSLRPQGTIIAANAMAAACLGCGEARPIGRDFCEFLPPEDAWRFRTHLESESCRGGDKPAERPAVLDVMLRRADAPDLPAQLSVHRGAARGARGAEIHVAITDVSQWRQVQTTLEHVKREQESFAYAISHDLRAPLITVGNYARILRDEHGRRLAPEGSDMLQRIETAAMRLERTLHRLLDFSDLLREPLETEPVNVDEVVADLLVEHCAAVREQQAEIEIARPLPPVRASRNMFARALSHVLSNALKYTPPGKRPRVRISAEVLPGKVRIVVADCGIGIPAAYHERIFRMFERLHSHRQYPGSGIGLAFVRRALDRMQGRIWVESEAGQGSRFVIELPKV